MPATYASPNYTAIERRAHQLRREAMSEMFSDLQSSIGRGIVLAQDVLASVRGRIERNRDAVFFEAQ